MKIKKIIIILVCLMILFVAGNIIISSKSQVDMGESNIETEKEDETGENEPLNLGQFAAETLEGDTITHDFFAKEKLTMINVWATFCGPCKIEMPGLGNLDREIEDFQVMGVVMDVLNQDGTINTEQIEAAKELQKLTNVHYPSAILNENLARLGFAQISSYPTTLFVDAEGNIVGDLVVGARDEDDWREIIEERKAAVK